MSDDSELNAQAPEFFRFHLKFSLAMSLTKLCASKCQLFKSNASTSLNSTEQECIKQCATTIEKNYEKFHTQVSSAIDFEDCLGIEQTE